MPICGLNGNLDPSLETMNRGRRLNKDTYLMATSSQP